MTLDEICEKHYNEVLRFIRNKIGNANYHDCYDITNKIFLKLTERQDTVVKLNDLAAKKFIYSTAKNYCMQYFQEISRKKSHEIELDDSFKITADTIAEEKIKDAIECIYEISSELTENERKLLSEYWLKNKNLFEIAEELHINYDNVKQMNSRLRKKLSSLIKSKLYE